MGEEIYCNTYMNFSDIKWFNSQRLHQMSQIEKSTPLILLYVCNAAPIKLKVLIRMSKKAETGMRSYKANFTDT